MTKRNFNYFTNNLNTLQERLFFFRIKYPKKLQKVKSFFEAGLSVQEVSCSQKLHIDIVLFIFDAIQEKKDNTQIISLLKSCPYYENENDYINLLPSRKPILAPPMQPLDFETPTLKELKTNPFIIADYV
jgi:hypothetical protein